MDDEPPELVELLLELLVLAEPLVLPEVDELPDDVLDASPDDVLELLPVDVLPELRLSVR